MQIEWKAERWRGGNGAAASSTGIARKVLIAAGLVCLFAGVDIAGAQSPGHDSLLFDAAPPIHDTIPPPNPVIPGRERNYFLPAVEIIGLNLGIGAVNTYIRDQHWAKISWQTMGDNIRDGFVWDEDGYIMNQLFHPYHGALYFNAARANGHDFWTSIPYAVFGSLMWEYLMENEPPSYNDIANTPITGTILGEMFWRISDLIIDESAVGRERFLRELSATIINPMRGFNRLLRGDMWRDGTNTVRENVDLDVSLGALNVYFDNSADNSRLYLMMRAVLEYGDQFDVDANKKAFDYFSLQTEVNAGPGDDILGIFASGVLWDDPIRLSSPSTSMIGIYKEVDIILNQVYKLSATMATAQIMDATTLFPGVDMQSTLGLSAILMGATNSEYAVDYERDHKVGPGLGAKAGVAFTFGNHLDVYAQYKRYWIHALSGAKSDQFVGLLNAGVGAWYSPQLKFTLEAVLYERYGRYRDYANTKSFNTGLRLFTTWRI